MTAVEFYNRKWLKRLPQPISRCRRVSKGIQLVFWTAKCIYNIKQWKGLRKILGAQGLYCASFTSCDHKSWAVGRVDAYKSRASEGPCILPAAMWCSVWRSQTWRYLEGLVSVERCRYNWAAATFFRCGCTEFYQVRQGGQQSKSTDKLMASVKTR